MAYLLAKFTLIFLLASVLGMVFGYWWCRRRFVDVTTSHRSLLAMHEEQQTLWGQLWTRLDASDASLVPKVREVVAEIPPPPTVDLSGLASKLETIEPGVRAAISAIEPPPAVNLGGLEQRLDGLRKAIEALPKPAPTVNLNPLLGEVQQLSSKLKGLARVDAHPPTDLSPVFNQCTDLSRQIAALSASRAEFGPDLSQLEGTLDSLSQRLDSLPSRFQCKAVAPAPATTPAPAAEPRLFTRPDHGQPDDLKKISGVGPKLERLLHANGVYYFWQVASWSRQDIEFIDQRLDVFKGRILRDAWVAQAQKLKQEDGSAPEPG